LLSPWVRRHLAKASMLSLAVSDGCDREIADGRKRRQACWARWKSGDWGFIPGVSLNWKPEPPVVGSGKLVAPCDRIQPANFSPVPIETRGEAGLCDEEPQAAIATAQPAAASTAPAWTRREVARQVVRARR
jgi:hypothetical protein